MKHLKKYNEDFKDWNDKKIEDLQSNIIKHEFKYRQYTRKIRIT